MGEENLKVPRPNDDKMDAQKWMKIFILEIQKIEISFFNKKILWNSEFEETQLKGRKFK